MEASFATTVQPPEGRGCGERVPEEPYACFGVGAGGSPIESFVLDPVRPWLDETVGRGAQILPRDPGNPKTLYDLVIIVGAKNYPFYWDFVEEARWYGTSRRLSRDMPFEKLTPGAGGSRQLFVHRFAIPQFHFEVQRSKPYWMCKHQFSGKWPAGCEFGHHYPVDPLEPCAFAGKDLAWLFHDDAEKVEVPGEPPMFRVKFGSTMYTGTYPKYPAPCTDFPLCVNDKDYNVQPCKECPQRQQFIGSQFKSAGPAFKHKSMWLPGIFMALPLSHFEFRDKVSPELQERLNKTGFETVVCDW